MRARCLPGPAAAGKTMTRTVRQRRRILRARVYPTIYYANPCITAGSRAPARGNHFAVPRSCPRHPRPSLFVLTGSGCTVLFSRMHHHADPVLKMTETFGLGLSTGSRGRWQMLDAADSTLLVVMEQRLFARSDTRGQPRGCRARMPNLTICLVYSG